MKVAIVGSGVSGLVCAHVLDPRHEVTLFEAESRLGGHAHTQEVTVDGRPVAVDTGFIVYNERNYPVLTRLFTELGIETRPSDMSFGVADDVENVEWCGSSLRGLFAQSRNALRPGYLRMLVDIARFNRRARRDLHDALLDPTMSLAHYLRRGRYGRAFREWYLVAMGSAIWSADPDTFTDFPAATFVRFFENHGLLGVRGRPEWRSVVGGSRTYVEALASRLRGRVLTSSPVTAVRRTLGGVVVTTPRGDEEFDHVIVATHSDQALALLVDADSQERDVLSALRYQENEAVLHTDPSILARREAARASWNWRRVPGSRRATLTYDLSRLQGLDGRPLYLTLNQPDAVDPSSVLSTTSYAHPVFDTTALRAQARHEEISGRRRVSFAGAYWGYGFHEDGAASAMRVCAQLERDVDVVEA
ncbi:MAG: NAD(P)-binding protein [Acidimicrobiaceae bacterium]|nr:NAD(P)-binding protein [Acidimicrobiaceae bacterium]